MALETACWQETSKVEILETALPKDYCIPGLLHLQWSVGLSGDTTCGP